MVRARPGLVEEFAVHLVVPPEVVHRRQVRRHTHEILSPAPTAARMSAMFVQHRPGLLPDVQRRPSRTRRPTPRRSCCPAAGSTYPTRRRTRSQPSHAETAPGAPPSPAPSSRQPREHLAVPSGTRQVPAPRRTDGRPCRHTFDDIDRSPIRVSLGRRRPGCLGDGQELLRAGPDTQWIIGWRGGVQVELGNHRRALDGGDGSASTRLFASISAGGNSILTFERSGESYV